MVNSGFDFNQFWQCRSTPAPLLSGSDAVAAVALVLHKTICYMYSTYIVYIATVVGVRQPAAMTNLLHSFAQHLPPWKSQNLLNSYQGCSIWWIGISVLFITIFRAINDGIMGGMGDFSLQADDVEVFWFFLFFFGWFWTFCESIRLACQLSLLFLFF